MSEERSSEEEEEEDGGLKSSFSGLYLADSESDEADAVVVEESRSEIKKRKKKKAKKKKKPIIEKKEDDDFDFLELAIIEKKKDEEDEVKDYLKFEAFRVDANREIEAKHGISFSSINKKRYKGIRKKNTKHCPYGDPGIDYGEIPSFQKGGIRWLGTTVEVSDDWRLASEALTMAGTPNEIGSLCAKKPYHAPSLIVAATMCCSMGLYEHAVPLCVRAAAVFTAYKRNEHVTKSEDSQPFFEALYLLGRLASKRGAYKTGLNFFRSCLRLNPQADVCLVSLRLASDLYRAEDYDTIFIFADSDYGKYIPDTLLCRALCNLKSTTEKNAVADLALTLIKIPQLFICLLDACEIRTDTINSRFRDLLWLEHFRKQHWLKHQAEAYALTALPRAIDVACLRGHSLWREHVHLDFLRKAAESVTQVSRSEQTPEAIQAINTFWSTSSLARQTAEIDVFAHYSDDFPRLDPGVIAEFDTTLLEAAAVTRFSRGQPHYTTSRRGVRPRDQPALADLMAQIPPDLRRQYQAQLDAGLPPAEIEASLLELFM